MNWGSAQAFFAMGGYAPYVWGSYGVARGLYRCWSCGFCAGAAELCERARVVAMQSRLRPCLEEQT